jgi:hypothetical protein
MTGSDPLRARLFGYGVPYRVRFTQSGEVVPLETGPAQEAAALADELEALQGFPHRSARQNEEGEWVISMPFGRCGVNGLPREYLTVYHLREGFLDVLDAEGYTERAIVEGETLTIVPGMVIRVRARPRAGHRVLVGFQTEDRTPLLGNAAPFTLKAHAAFVKMKQLASDDSTRYQTLLQGFFATMAEALAGNEEIPRIQQAARREGAYDVDDERDLSIRQQALLSPEVVERIRHQDEELFRFPGMFGGITTLFRIIAQEE